MLFYFHAKAPLCRFRKDRLVKLGPDLAASAFLIARGGTVKFVGKEPWVKKTGVQLVSLPGKFDPEFKLEGIDCSRVKFHHVGMDNLGKMCVFSVYMKWVLRYGIQEFLECNI